METKMIRIPFDVDLAKKITKGEAEGCTVTRDGRSVRIVCFDAKQDEPIVALISYNNEDNNNAESVKSYAEDGIVYKGRTHLLDLMLEIPIKKSKCEFKPFDKVLVRNSDEMEWIPRFFERYSETANGGRTITMDRNSWKYCIPYEGNEHLLGTTENYE